MPHLLMGVDQVTAIPVVSFAIVTWWWFHDRLTLSNGLLQRLSRNQLFALLLDILKSI